jgi:hypothetical protein
MKFSKSDTNIVFELGRWNHNPSMRTLVHKKGHLHSGLGISLVHHQHQVYKKELAGSHWKHCFSSSASSSSDSLSSLVDSFQQNHSANTDLVTASDVQQVYKVNLHDLITALCCQNLAYFQSNTL